MKRIFFTAISLIGLAIAVTACTDYDTDPATAYTKAKASYELIKADMAVYSALPACVGEADVGCSDPELVATINETLTQADEAFEEADIILTLATADPVEQAEAVAEAEAKLRQLVIFAALTAIAEAT